MEVNDTWHVIKTGCAVKMGTAFSLMLLPWEIREKKFNFTKTYKFVDLAFHSGWSCGHCGKILQWWDP